MLVRYPGTVGTSVICGVVDNEVTRSVDTWLEDWYQLSSLVTSLALVGSFEVFVVLSSGRRICGTVTSGVSIVFGSESSQGRLTKSTVAVHRIIIESAERYVDLPRVLLCIVNSLSSIVNSCSWKSHCYLA